MRGLHHRALACLVVTNLFSMTPLIAAERPGKVRLQEVAEIDSVSDETPPIRTTSLMTGRQSSRRQCATPPQESCTSQCAPQSPPITNRDIHPPTTDRGLEHEVIEEEVGEQGPVMFQAPPANGETFGEGRSIELPSLSMTIPEIRLGMPRFAIQGPRKSRRNAEMHMDSARAPLVQGNPALYGQLLATGETPRVTRTITREIPGQDRGLQPTNRGLTPPVEDRGLHQCVPKNECAPKGAARGTSPYPQPTPVSDPNEPDQLNYPPPAPPSEARRQMLRQLREAEAQLRRNQAELQRLQGLLEDNLNAVPQMENNLNEDAENLSQRDSQNNRTQRSAAIRRTAAQQRPGTVHRQAVATEEADESVKPEEEEDRPSDSEMTIAEAEESEPHPAVKPHAPERRSISLSSARTLRSRSPLKK